MPLHAFGGLAAVVGAIVWRWTPLVRPGQLMITLGITYHLGDLRSSAQPTLFAIGFCLGYLWVAVAVHLALSWPTGNLHGRWPVILVAASYAASVATQIARYVIDNPVGPQGYDFGGPGTAAAQAGSLALVALGIAVVLTILHRWRHASGAWRRPWAPVWLCVVITAAIALSFSATSFLGASVHTQFAFAATVLLVGLFVVPVAYTAQLVRAAAAQTRLARLALDLDRGIGVYTTRDQLRKVLAKALGDPTLTLHFPDSVADTLSEVTDVPGRARTGVWRADRLVCVLDHDIVLTHQPAVMQAAAAAAGLAVERTEMHERLLAQMDQLRASRHRLADTEARERQRIQGELHDTVQGQLRGIQTQLDTALLHLHRGEPTDVASARAIIAKVHRHLGEAIAEFRRRIAAIYPPILAEDGLAAAIEELLDWGTLAASISVPARRWTPSVERTAFFLIAEAVGNVYKHARADRIDLRIVDDGERLTVTVTDNGVGLKPGITRVRSLEDRAAAAGGDVCVSSNQPCGTRVTIRLPLEEP